MHVARPTLSVHGPAGAANTETSHNYAIPRSQGREVACTTHLGFRVSSCVSWTPVRRTTCGGIASFPCRVVVGGYPACGGSRSAAYRHAMNAASNKEVAREQGQFSCRFVGLSSAFVSFHFLLSPVFKGCCDQEAIFISLL